MGAPPPRAFRQGDRIVDRYELEELLGRGGMGEVWRAKHLALNSHVAIKFLVAASAQQETARKRFLHEAQVTAQIKTRHAVQVFDFGITEDGQPFLVMELLDGETVGHRLERAGKLPRAATVRFLQQAARALDRAHALGIVHRDFKPDNLVIVKDEDGRESIKVLDFGIAKIVGDLEAVSVPGPDLAGRDADSDTEVESARSMSLTATNAVLGTPHYMAPEQVRREELGPTTDVWAFGVVAFECLTGVLPFDGNTLMEIFTRIQARRHLSVRELAPELPEEFDEWFGISCARAPVDRFRSATVAARALAVSLESARWEREKSSSGVMPALPTATPSSSGSREPSIPDGVLPRAGLRTGARLLARAPRRTFGDTHDPVSRPLGPEGRSAGPVSPPPAVSRGAPRRSKGREVRRIDRRVMTFAVVSAAVLAGGVVAWRALRAGSPEAPPSSAAVAVSATPLPAVDPAQAPARANSVDAGTAQAREPRTPE